MFYVFHVSAGKFLHFDMQIAMGTVEGLKDAIFRNHAIPPEHQVLMVSGGQLLQSGTKMTMYTTGTDSNPVYLFCLKEPELSRTVSQYEPDTSDSVWEQRITASINDPGLSIEIVTARANLAMQVYDIDVKKVNQFKELVREQHIQQQGWCAVVANLDDSIRDFQERFDAFVQFFKEHFEQRDEYIRCLTTFNEDLERLSRVKILPGLLEHAELKPFAAFDCVYEDKDLQKDLKKSNDVVETSGTCTLLEWILAKNNRQILNLMAKNCETELERFNEEFLEVQQKAVADILHDAVQDKIVKIEGLSERLQGLDKLAAKADKYLGEQHDMAQAFAANQKRTVSFQDKDVLPQLCEAHRNQLKVMLRKHIDITDIRNRAARAKEELAISLVNHVRCVMDIENEMQRLDGSTITYHAYLLRVRKHLSIVEQIHRAPTVYAHAINEVVRRREYSNAFLSWAKELSSRIAAVYTDEMERRIEFSEMVDGHFLINLFPGMNDLPSAYATETSAQFDASLPNLNRSDLDELAKQLPECTDEFRIFQDLENKIKFFTESRNHVKRALPLPDKATEETTDVNQTMKPPDPHAHLKEYEKGFESETDTEEFEKVSQSPVDSRQTASQTNPAVILPPTTIKPEVATIGTSAYNVEMVSVETLTNETFESTQSEIMRLKSLLCQMHEKSLTNIASFRSDLHETRDEVTRTQAFHMKQTTELRNGIDALETEAKNRERELIQRLTVDFELEMNDIRKTLSVKEEELLAIRGEKETMEASHMDAIMQLESEKGVLRDANEKLSEELNEVKKELEMLKASKDREIAEAKEKMEKEHKLETDLMRSRIKMITSVDRSPSDTSLEKIERPDMIDLASHEAILAQQREELQKEKEAAIAAALEFERPSTSTQSQSRSPSHEIVQKRLIDEVTKKLDEAKVERDLLQKECMKMKEIIAQSVEDAGILDELRERVRQLESEKVARENENQSSSNPPKSSGKRYITINVRGCDKEDNVLVTWSPPHHQYTVFQDNSRFYVLHETSYHDMGLTTVARDATPTKLFAFGTVVEREYCHARRQNNRYRIDAGSKFYRVKAKNLDPPVPMLSSSSSANRASSDGAPTATTTSQQTTDATIVVTAPTATTASNPLVDSCAQTDMEPPMQDDMVDSGVQRSMVRSQRTISEEIVTQLDEAAAVDANEEMFQKLKLLTV